MQPNRSGVGWSACLLALLLAGCADMLPPPQPSQPQLVLPPALPSAADDILELMDRFSRASPAELAREYDALAAIPEATRGGNSLLRLSLLLSQPGLPFRDDAAALRVLQEWEKRQPAAEPALKAFVRWMRAMLGERARLAGALDDAGARLREERKRAEVCKEKLEAIKNMEKSLIERDKH